MMEIKLKIDLYISSLTQNITAKTKLRRLISKLTFGVKGKNNIVSQKEIAAFTTIGIVG